MIIGITGTLGSGKGAVVKFLERHGFKHYSVRQYLIEKIEERGLPVNRDSMVKVANELREANSPSFIVEELYKQAAKEGGDSIIESIRTVGEVEALQKLGGYLIAVDADSAVRYSRVLIRQSETDNITFDEFLSNEAREMDNADSTKQNLGKCIEMADFVIDNNRGFDELNKQIVNVYRTIQEIESKKEDIDETVKKVLECSASSASTSTNTDVPRENLEREGIVKELEKEQNKVMLEGNTSADREENKLQGEANDILSNVAQVKKDVVVGGKREDYISWDEYFMGVAMLSAMRSKDPSTQVGACIVDEYNHIVATGYNGFPIGCSDDELPWAREGERLDTKYIYVCHAELNAILNSTKDLHGCKIYIALAPCNECAKAIIQSGINEVVYISDKYAHVDEFIAGRRMLEMAGVKMRQYTPENKNLVIDFERV